MSTFDVRHWGGLDRLSNVEQELAQVANGGSQTLVFNVQTAYGARGDGVTDDSAAVAAAAAAAKAAGGGIVYFPRGTYLCNTPQNAAPTNADGHARAVLYFTGLAHVRFAGDGATLKTTLSYASTLLEVRDSNDIDVVGLHFYGNQLISSDVASSNVSGSGIRFTNVLRGEISGNELEQVDFSAVYLTGGTSKVKVLANDFHDLGVVGVGSNTANAINEDSVNGTDAGAATPPFGNLIADNTILNCRGSGAIVLDNGGSSTHTIVRNNTIDNAGAFVTASFQGIRLYNSVDVLIQGNTVRNCNREGIYVTSTASSLTNLRIVENIVNACGVAAGYAGVLIDNAGNGEIRGWNIDANTVRGCGGHGIAIAMSGANQVRDGSICNNTLIGNDQFSRGTTDAISFGGHRATISGNMVTTPGGTTFHRYGISTTASAQGPIVALGNVLLGTVTAPYNDTNAVLYTRVDEQTSALLWTITGQIRLAKLAPTYSASITPDASVAAWQTIVATNATAFTVNAPTNPPGSTQTTELVIEISNTSGGAMGAITWNSAFVLIAGAFTNPATANKRYIRFQWNGTKWIEMSRASADYA